MDILYIHQHFSTPAGAGGTRSYEFARRLVQAGHRVTMVCGASGRSDTMLEVPFVRGCRTGTIDGVELIEYDVGYSTFDGIFTRIRKFLRFGYEASRIALRHRYDIIFATSTPLTVAFPGILARWLRRKPFVFEVRDLWPELPKALGVKNPFLLKSMSALEWAAYHSAHHVVGLAPGIVDGILRRGLASSRVSFVPNGCDVDLFGDAASADDFQSAPTELSSQDHFVCIYAGAHGIANGLEALVPVAAELKRRGRFDIKFFLIGGGATKARLQEQVREFGLEEIMIFRDGIPKVQLVSMLKRADAGLQILKNVPAFYDGTSPNKFFDYLAAGVPVLVNYPGWIASLVKENDCGATVPPNSPEAFADILEEAAENRSRWRLKGMNSRALAEARFNRDHLATRFVEVLERTHAAQASRGARSKLATHSEKM